jgi:DNA-binding FadR family transcriptional regulator
MRMGRWLVDNIGISYDHSRNNRGHGNRNDRTGGGRRSLSDRRRTSLIYSKRSLHGQVAHDLGRRILRGELAPGAVFPNEAEFSASLSVSRTALREAIKVLAAKGLVESRPKTGTRVRPRSDWNLLDPDVLAWQFAAGPFARFIKDLFELRQMIEPQAAAMAARRAGQAEIGRIEQAYRGMEEAGNDSELWIDPDLRFHQAIIRATGNELLWPLGAIIETALATSFRLSSAHWDGPIHSLPLHRAILDAIRERDPEAAHAAMQRLLADAANDVRRALADKRAKAPKRGAVRERRTRLGNAA